MKHTQIYLKLQEILLFSHLFTIFLSGVGGKVSHEEQNDSKRKTSVQSKEIPSH